MKNEIDGRNNEIQNQSLQHEDIIDQLSNENEEIMSLRSENKKIRNNLISERQINESLQSDLRSETQINESLENDLITKKKVNERMMKSQEYMNRLNQKNEQNLIDKKVKLVLDTKKKVNLPSKLPKEIKNLHAITMER